MAVCAEGAGVTPKQSERIRAANREHRRRFRLAERWFRSHYDEPDTRKEFDREVLFAWQCGYLSAQRSRAAKSCAR